MAVLATLAVARQACRGGGCAEMVGGSMSAARRGRSSRLPTANPPAVLRQIALEGGPLGIALLLRASRCTWPTSVCGAGVRGRPGHRRAYGRTQDRRLALGPGAVARRQRAQPRPTATATRCRCSPPPTTRCSPPSRPARGPSASATRRMAHLRAEHRRRRGRGHRDRRRPARSCAPQSRWASGLTRWPSPAGAPFVTNQYAGTVSVIDLEKWQKIADLPTGSIPKGLPTRPTAPACMSRTGSTIAWGHIDAASLQSGRRGAHRRWPRAFGQFIARVRRHERSVPCHSASVARSRAR